MTRNYSSAILVLLLGCGAVAEAAVWEPAPSFPDAGVARAYVAALSLEDTLFALGGRPFDAQDDAKVHRLSGDAPAWSFSPSLEGSVVHVGSGIDALGRLVVFGGSDLLNGDSGNSYVYDLLEGPAEGLAARLGAAPDTLFAWTTDAAGRIYSLGGGPGANGTNSNDAQRYDGPSDSWQVLPPLPNAVADAAACLAPDGRVLLIGGYTATGSARSGAVQVFDPDAGSWSNGVLPELPVGLSGHAAALGADGRVYVVGGLSGAVGAGIASAEVWVLDFAALDWSVGPALATPRRHHGLALHRDHLYALGGMNAAGGTETVERLFTPPCPEFLLQPSDAEPWSSQTFVCEAAVSGGEPLSYRWRRDGVDLLDGEAPGGGVISGASTPTLVITGIGLADSGAYALLASNPCGETLSDAAVVAVRTPPAFPAEWTAESLHPAGALGSTTLAIDAMRVSGHVTVDGAEGAEEHAWRWDLAAGTQEPLHPVWDPPSPKSWAKGVHGDTAVGFWWHPYEILHNGQWYVIYQPKACRWIGGAGGFAEVILGGSYEYTYLNAVDASGSVGTASYDDAVGNYYSRAFMIGSGGQITFLHPSDIASNSYGSAIDAGRQYGHFNTPYPGPRSHAAMWQGSAASVADLHPASASRSWISHAGDGQQIGSAEFAGVLKPLLWYGATTGWVDMSPTDGSSVSLEGVGGGLQVGSQIVGGVQHACAWRGQGEDRMDLHDWLPPVYDSSLALDVDVDAEGRIRVVGRAYREDLSRSEAIVWTAGPGATSVEDVPASAPGRQLALRLWPNPGREGGTVSFALPRAGEVRLELFAPNGRRVRTLRTSNLDAGEHHLTWTRRSSDGTRLSSGLYLMRLRAGGLVATGKLVLMD